MAKTTYNSKDLDYNNAYNLAKKVVDKPETFSTVELKLLLFLGGYGIDKSTEIASELDLK